MREVPTTEAKLRFAELLRVVEYGESIAASVSCSGQPWSASEPVARSGDASTCRPGRSSPRFAKVDGDKRRRTSRRWTTPPRFFLEWKQPYPLSVKQLGDKLGRKPSPQDILLYGLLEPRNLLDIVRNFVVFEAEGGRTVAS